MKPTFEFKEGLLDNAGKFRDPFFERFALRPAPEPLRLSDTISKTYQFPTFYRDVTCAIGIFLCDYEKTRRILPHPAMKPVRMTRGRSLVAFSCYHYAEVLGIPPYNEIAMTIPLLAGPGLDLPVLPMIASGLFPQFGYYVFGMPVTSKENQLRGNRIWGLPKVTQEIDLFEDAGDCVTVAKEEGGEPYFSLRVPMSGKPTDFDVSGYLYTKLGERFLKSQTCFKASFNVTKNMGQLLRKGGHPDREYLKIGSSPSARVLRELDIEEVPFQFRYAKTMVSAFDLPAGEWKP